MTKKEAIEIIMCGDISNRWGDDGKEAERMAIKALEQETVTEFADRCRECGAKYGKLLKQQPKTGHWKVVSDGYGDNAYICECSECKDTVWVYKDADRKWNYCPNCGAKMKSEG